MSTCETATLLSVYFERIVICGFDIVLSFFHCLLYFSLSLKYNGNNSKKILRRQRNADDTCFGR